MSWCTRTIADCSIANSVGGSSGSADAVIAVSVIAVQRANSKVGAARLRKPTRAINTALVAHAIMPRAKRAGVGAKTKK
jgi:ABC-type antimicrobial peptide transport system ATPase subunit